MDATEAFQHLSKVLQGSRVSHVWRGYGSALFVECGPLSDSQVIRKDGTAGNPRGRWTIDLACDWRVESESFVMLGSHDEDRIWSAEIGSLVDDEIAGVEIVGQVPELCVKLSSGKRLRTFALDQSGPQWALSDNAHQPALWVYWSDGSLRTGDGRQVR